MQCKRGGMGRKGKRDRSCKIKVTRNFERSRKVASKFVRRISILLIRQRSEKFRTRFSQRFFDVQVYRCRGKGQVHLGNAFPVGPTAPRPFLLKLGRSVPRFGKTEFQRKVFVSVAVNAKLLRLFLSTRDSHRRT